MHIDDIHLSIGVLFVHTEIEHRRSIMMGQWSHMYIVYMQNHAWVHFTSFSALPLLVLVDSYILDVCVCIRTYRNTKGNYMTRQNDAIDSMFFCRCIEMYFTPKWIVFFFFLKKKKEIKNMQMYFYLFAFYFVFMTKNKWQWDKLIRFNMKSTCQLYANLRRKREKFY